MTDQKNKPTSCEKCHQGAMLRGDIPRLSGNFVAAGYVLYCMAFLCLCIINIVGLERTFYGHDPEARVAAATKEALLRQLAELPFIPSENDGKWDFVGALTDESWIAKEVKQTGMISDTTMGKIVLSRGYAGVSNARYEAVAAGQTLRRRLHNQALLMAACCAIAFVCFLVGSALTGKRKVIVCDHCGYFYEVVEADQAKTARAR